MKSRCRIYLASALLGFLPLEVWASLEVDRTCEGEFCWSLTKHRSEQLKDYYWYVRPKALKHLVIRYQSGAKIDLLIRSVPAGQCGRSFVSAMEFSPQLLRGRGCIVTKRGDSAVSLNYEVSASNAAQLLHKVAPVIWLSGHSENGNFLPAASVLLPLNAD